MDATKISEKWIQETFSAKEKDRFAIGVGVVLLFGGIFMYYFFKDGVAFIPAAIGVSVLFKNFNIDIPLKRSKLE